MAWICNERGRNVTLPFQSPTAPETARERDERLLTEWKRATGFSKDQKLSELLKNLSGAIGTAVNSYRGAPVPQVTLELEAKRQALLAIQDWDRSKGMSLASYVTTMVKQRLYRYIGTHANVARLPEGQIRQIGPIREAVSDLTSKFGREPTTDELADHLGMPVKQITRLRRNLRSDLLEEGGGLDNIEHYNTDPGFERAMMAYYQLTDMEKLVFDFSLGAHGQPRLKPTEIASRLKISNGRVSQLKTSLGQKLKPYLGDK
jgi:DNA-directed RNA polymerase specialized sigma subunit